MPVVVAQKAEAVKVETVETCLCEITFTFSMESVCFELSGRGIGDAAALDERNFVFIVGGVEYRCSRFQACFVSGLVRRLLVSDCCLSRLCLKVCDDESHFKDVVRLMNGERISITRANTAFLEACARELENDELLDRILSLHLDGDISIVNVVDRIRIKSQSHSDCKSELDFLASHFFEVETDVLRGLSVSDLELVLTSPLLKLESEDQLYDTIVSLAGEKGDNVLTLLRYVEFEFLSDSKLGEFLDRIFPDLVALTWGSICDCLHRFCGLDAKKDLMKAERYHSFPTEIGSSDDMEPHPGPLAGATPRHIERHIDEPDAGFREEDIQTIMQQSNVDRASAIEALRGADGDLVTAVMNLAR